MKILITGATGFIGKHLIRELSKTNFKFKCLARKKSEKRDLEYLKKFNAEIFDGNILNKKDLEKATRDIEIVIHLVGIGDVTETSKEKLKEYNKINIGGTKNLLDSCKGIKKFIYFSSTASIGVINNKIVDEKTSCMPKTSYEKSKYLAEQLVLRYKDKFPIIIFRPSMIFGPYEKHSLIPLTYKIIRTGSFFIPGNGKNKTGLVYVKDVVSAVINSIKNKKVEGVYILTNQISFNEFTKIIAKSYSLDVKIIHLPVFLVKIGIVPITFFCKLIGKTPLFTLKRIDSITANRIYDVSKAKKDLGFKNTSLKKAIKETIDWYKNKKIE